MEYTIQTIAEAIDARFLSSHFPDTTKINSLSIDSRNIKNNSQSVFFAIVGARNNGHQFIEHLYHDGIRNFVVSDQSCFKETYKEANFLLVKDTLTALQLLAKKHRERYQFPVIGITGSNGKTIVKEWLFQLLRNDYLIVRSPKSYNSQVGVPLSVWQINEENNLGLFEAGISLPKEMKNLERVIQPQIGVFTNIGEAHAENFVDINQKIEEKLKLFEKAEHLIYCKDYDLLHEAIKKSAIVQQINLFTWSKKSNADLLIVKTEKDKLETLIQGIYKSDFLQIVIPFSDDASIENAIHCWCVMLFLGIDHGIIKERMHYLSPVAMRLELKQGINNCSIINDSYNSDLGSLAIALDFLNQQNQHPNKKLILSDILQSGKEEEKLYAEVAEMCLIKGITKFIGIGQALFNNQHLFKFNQEFYKNTEDFLRSFTANKFKDETILLKGARLFKFEQISKLLQQKAHQTVLEVNLSALVNNINYYRSNLNQNTKIMAMVKAFSYGSGSFEIANVLQYNRVNYLAVAYADEGVELRKAGIKLPIMVMSPEAQSFDNIMKYNLEPEIYSFKILKEFTEAIGTNPIEKIAVHIKLDTGMHRLGFEDEDVNELCVRLKNANNIIVKSVFSHLVASDEFEHDEFTKHQINTYLHICKVIENHLGYSFIKHILNSAGALRFKEYQFDMVRLGIGMHGFSAVQHPAFIPTVQLKTIISQIKNVAASQTVGYSRKGKLTKNTKIGTVPIGYADGYTRKLGNGVGVMLVNGKLAPTIGNICMDMTMLDITDLEVQEGDEVIVFGEGYPIADLAKAAGTIPYEVLTNMSSRIKRIYYQE
jgi:alanine racemase